MASSALTWETDALHLVSMVTAQRGVQPLEVGVSAYDDCWSFIAAAGLDDVDGVQLQTKTHLHILIICQSRDLLRKHFLSGLTTYLEVASCTTLASVTSNNKLSVCNLLQGVWPPAAPPPCRLQLS